MIGRESEIGEVSVLIADEAVRGVALSGKPGVGKSRLAREAVDVAAEAGWDVRSVAATATSRAIPMGAFAQWTDDGHGEPVVLVRKVVETLTAGTRSERLLVFIDDAHLLDDLSALVVHQIVHSQAATVVVTIRSGESAPAAVTALWKDGLLCSREVEPLTREGIDELVKAVIGATPDQQCGEKLWRLTHGNVLFLRQLVEQENKAGRLVAADGAVRWQGDAAISGSLAQLVDTQIGAVPGDVRDVVDFVAVAEPIGWHCLRLLADPAAIEAAEQRELIRTLGDDVYIGHPMYAEVRLNRCGPSRLRRLRGQIATAMKDSGGPADDMKRGMLWLESDLPAEPDVLLSAATAASSLLDFEAAERLLTAAAETGGGLQARVPLAYSLFMMQKGELALEVLDGVEDDETQTTFLNDVVMRAANLLWARRAPDLSWRVIDEALAGASGVRRQQLTVFRANQLALAARPVEVLDALAGIDYRDLDFYGATMGLSAECMAHGELGQCDRAVAKAVESGRALSRSAQGEYLRHPLVEFHTFALAAAGRTAEAVYIAESHCRAHRAAPLPAQVLASEILGMTQLAAGDLDAVLRLVPEALDANGVEVANSFHVANSFYRFQLLRAQALARTGDVDGARRSLEMARTHWHPAYVYVETTEMLVEAWLAAGCQRLTEARVLARRAADFARGRDQFAREVWCLQTAVQFDAIDAAVRLAELAEVVEGPRVVVAARYAAALTADDAAELDQVSAEFEMIGDLLASADAAGQAATSHRRAGRAGSAITSATRAHRLAVMCGGATSPAIEAAAVAPPFTNREREIAVLVARGLSNREIAEAVSLSVRTVESHIYRASTKAGVGGRSALAELMQGSG